MPSVVISGTFMGTGYYVDYGGGLIPQVLITGSMGGGRIATPSSVNNSNKQPGIDRPCVSTCNPVFIATGEKHKDEADFKSVGVYGPSLTRTYRSRHATGRLFGSHWVSTLDPPTIKPSGTYKAPWGTIPASYLLTDQNGATFVYSYHSPGPIRDDSAGAPDRSSDDPTKTPGNPNGTPQWVNYRSNDSAAAGMLIVQPGDLL